MKAKVQQNTDATFATEDDNSPDTVAGANERDKVVDCDTEEEDLHQHEKGPLDTLFYKKIQMKNGLNPPPKTV